MQCFQIFLIAKNDKYFKKVTQKNSPDDCLVILLLIQKESPGTSVHILQDELRFVEMPKQPHELKTHREVDYSHLNRNQFKMWNTHNADKG
jgi:predicted acetyltransferase